MVQVEERSERFHVVLQKNEYEGDFCGTLKEKWIHNDRPCGRSKNLFEWGRKWQGIKKRRQNWLNRRLRSNEEGDPSRHHRARMGIGGPTSNCAWWPWRTQIIMIHSFPTSSCSLRLVEQLWTVSRPAHCPRFTRPHDIIGSNLACASWKSISIFHT